MCIRRTRFDRFAPGEPGLSAIRLYAQSYGVHPVCIYQSVAGGAERFDTGRPANPRPRVQDGTPDTLRNCGSAPPRHVGNAGQASSVEPATPHPATSPAGHQPMNMKKRWRWGVMGCLLGQTPRSASTAHYGLLRPQTTDSSATAYLPTTEMPSNSRVSRSLAPVAPPEHPVLSLETPQLRLHAKPHPIIFTRR